MSIARLQKEPLTNLPFYEERVDLAAPSAGRRGSTCTRRWPIISRWRSTKTARKFLMNPNQVHFSRIKASDLLLIDANDPDTLTGPNAPDPTAWGLHGAIHRNVPHARCVMHVHSIHATVLASLADSTLPPIDQNSAMFFNRHVVDAHYGGLAFEEEGERCSQLLADPRSR